MEYVVLGTWIVQGAVGVVLLTGWLRHARGRNASTVLTHVALSLAGLVAWVWFLLSGTVIPAWIALGTLTVGNALGDSMLIRRHRRATGVTTGYWRDYGTTIAAVFRGGFPRPVAFHAVFAGVVYFTCLGVCIGATVAAAS